MIRMEIALFLVLVFIACMYFSAERRSGMLHRTFRALLLVVPVHLIFDAVTIYTVNRLDTVPHTVNDILLRCFICTLVVVMYLFYQYIAVLVEDETGKPRRLDFAARLYLALQRRSSRHCFCRSITRSRRPATIRAAMRQTSVM